MKVLFMGARQAGIIGLLTLMASGYTVNKVVSYDNLLDQMCMTLGYLPRHSIKDIGEIDADFLISVHAREIVPLEILKQPRIGCINVHPCLYKYKGKDPIQRFLIDGGRYASVGVHWMSTKVDEGVTILEEFVDVAGIKTVEGIYNELYPHYATALIKALRCVVQ
jgi:methionyl-tRNA formyltransferase